MTNKNSFLSSNEGESGGVFIIPIHSKTSKTGIERLTIIAGVDSDWEHVSVSLPNRTPTWEEMCKVKDLFWEEHECVIQYHPPKEDYVNLHKHCLHLWRPLKSVIPMPEIERV